MLRVTFFMRQFALLVVFRNLQRASACLRYVTRPKTFDLEPWTFDLEPNTSNLSPPPWGEGVDDAKVPAKDALA